MVQDFFKRKNALRIPYAEGAVMSMKLLLVSLFHFNVFAKSGVVGVAGFSLENYHKYHNDNYNDSESGGKDDNK